MKALSKAINYLTERSLKTYEQETATQELVNALNNMHAGIAYRDVENRFVFCKEATFQSVWGVHCECCS